MVLRPCKHCDFHPACIDRALEACGRCPLCRTPVEQVHWELDAIVAHRSISGGHATRAYLVTWKGFSMNEATWVPEAELRQFARRLLRQYQEKVMRLVDLVAEEARAETIEV